MSILAWRHPIACKSWCPRTKLSMNTNLPVLNPFESGQGVTNVGYYFGTDHSLCPAIIFCDSYLP